MGGDRAVVVAFMANAVLAGGNAVAIRFSNRELDPLWGASLRFLLATVILFGVMVALDLTVPRGRALGGAALFGVFNFAGAFGLAYYGFVEVHAGLGQTLLALVPLLTLLLAVLERQERLHASAVGGAVLALLGIALISRATVSGGIPVLSFLAVIGSAACFAQAVILLRRLQLHPVTVNAVGMASGVVVLLVLSVVLGEQRVMPGRTETWVALAYVVVVGSVAVFLLYAFVASHWEASRASYLFVLIPFVTVLLSMWLDGEPLRVGLLVGGPLVLGGVYVGALRPATGALDVGSPDPTP